MVKLKRLLIRKYRNVKPGTELRFDDGINVLLGRNGTGKTTLLELISIVLRGDFSTLKTREFDLQYTLFGIVAKSDWTIDVAVRSHPREMVVTATVEAQLPEWSFELHLTSSEHEVRVRGRASELAYLNAQGEWQKEANPFPIFESPLFNAAIFGVISAGSVHAARGALLLRGTATRFDEALDYERALVTAKASTVQREKVVDGIPVGVDLQIHSDFDLPPDVASALKTVVNQKLFPDTLRVHADAVRLLMKLARVAQVDKVDLLIQLRRSSPQQFVIGPFRFELTKRDGTTLDHDDLSFGEKRMLAFFWYLASNSDALIADELVNGLHHEWIETCIQEIGDRQAFVTAQNPLLVDYLPDFTSAEQVANRFIQCRSELRDVDETTKAEEFVWGNMSAEDAERFFRAYEVGIQHVGEILRTEGLW